MCCIVLPRASIVKTAAARVPRARPARFCGRNVPFISPAPGIEHLASVAPTPHPMDYPATPPSQRASSAASTPTSSSPPSAFKFSPAHSVSSASSYGTYDDCRFAPETFTSADFGGPLVAAEGSAKPRRHGKERAHDQQDEPLLRSVGAITRGPSRHAADKVVGYQGESGSLRAVPDQVPRGEWRPRIERSSATDADRSPAPLLG